MQFFMKCCGKNNPIGVDLEHIRLSFETDGRKEIQSYVVNIATSIERLQYGKYLIQLKEDSRDAPYLVYPDKNIWNERTKYYWQIKAQTGQGVVTSPVASFETGLSGFRAVWIGNDRDEEGKVLEFQKKFRISGKITKARLYISGLGYFRGRLDGVLLDDSYYKPLVMDYESRAHPENPELSQVSGHQFPYCTYDVTEYLTVGEHLLSVEVANGYYCNTDHLPEELDFSYGLPKLIFELHLTEAEEERVIISDTDTMVRAMNYRSTLYAGDFVDFTTEPGEFVPSVQREAPDGKPVCILCEEDRVREILKPVHTWSCGEKRFYDFGVNHTGGLELCVTAGEEADLIIRYAEIQNSDGTLNYETSAWHDKDPHTGQMRDIYQKNTYRLKKGVNRIEPLYSWYGYRYVEIELPDAVQIQKIQSLFICTDVKRNGHFECSEPLFQQLNEVFLQTLLCNMHGGLMMDCPHREKRAYTGDGQLTMKASYYNLDSVTFYYKWLEDILAAQTEDGMIPHSAPLMGGGGGYAWGNAVCNVTEHLYHMTGDKATAKKGYQAILKWLGYYEIKRNQDYIICANSHKWMLGDWLAPETVASNVYYVNTVCYKLAVDAALRLADEFDPERVGELKELSDHIRAGIQKVFFDEATLSYGNGVQGEDMLALAAGIVPEAYQKALEEKVAQHYSVETDYHLDTGIVLTPILIEYLTDHGHPDIAYRIMTAKTYPSYAELMEEDTTLSEHWSKKWPDYYIGGEDSKLIKGGGDLSHCHPMYGSVCAWLYERVAGLDLTELYRKKVEIKPYFTDCMEWAKANKITPYGKVCVEWEHTKEGIKLGVIVPKGLTGEVSFPSQYYTMQNLCTGETYTATPDGYFRFRLPAGEWVLQTKGREEESSMTVKEYVEKNLPLSIRTNKEDSGALIGLPYPYIIPSVADMFQEMYYWDSYFANAGLIIRGDIEQAKNNVDDLRYLLDRYGFVLNGNNKGFEYNSQPPFLGKMIREVYDVTGDKEWLKECYTSLKKENAFWMEKRNTGFGLNHYDCEPLTEQMVKNGVRDLVGRIGYKPDCTAEEIARGNFSTGESGWDFNPRMRHETYKYAPADLNSLLYIQEDELEYFAGELGLVEEQQIWKERKEKRAELCRQYLKGEDGVFYDYHLEKKELNGIVSAASFYPLYAGMATKEEAEAAMKVLPRIEMTYGVAACEKCDDIPGNFQWGYPNGWPPMQRIMVEGLLKYGYEEDAKRIAEKYIALVDRCLETTGNMWEKYNVVEGNVEVVDEYKMPAMLGWTFGVYYRFCRLLGKEL